jgi:hypothetical protein
LNKVQNLQRLYEHPTATGSIKDERSMGGLQI